MCRFMYPVCMKVNYHEALSYLCDRSNVSDYPSALFESVGWVYPHEKNTSDNKLANSEMNTIVSELKEYSEQQHSQSNKISFPGGEIKVISSMQKQSSELVTQLTAKELLDNLSAYISGDALNKRYSLQSETLNKLNHSNGIKVLFVNDVLLDDEEQVDEQIFDANASHTFVPQLKTAFSLEVSELFARMIQAMQLSHSDFLISGTKIKKQSQEINFLSQLYNEILYFRPQIVITLGAIATQTLLDSRDRLAKVHGQIFHKKINGINDQEFLDIKIMPLFHPELLLINPNMKKTAWIDMQKAMKEVGIGDIS